MTSATDGASGLQGGFLVRRITKSEPSKKTHRPLSENGKQDFEFNNIVHHHQFKASKGDLNDFWPINTWQEPDLLELVSLEGYCRYPEGSYTVFHSFPRICFWSRKLKRVTRSDLGVELMAFTDVFDKKFSIKHDFKDIPGQQIPLNIFTDILSLFEALTKETIKT